MSVVKDIVWASSMLSWTLFLIIIIVEYRNNFLEAFGQGCSQKSLGWISSGFTLTSGTLFYCIARIYFSINGVTSAHVLSGCLRRSFAMIVACYLNKIKTVQHLSAASIWFGNWGLVGPGLKSGIVSPQSSTDGGT